MRNTYTEYQNPRMHGSQVMLCIKKREERTDGQTDERRQTYMPRQLFHSWGHKKGAFNGPPCMAYWIRELTLNH